MEAVDARDWERACALSVPFERCPQRLAEGLGDWERPLRAERLRRERDGAITFDVSTALTRGEVAPAEPGWTAYAPLVLRVEERGGRHAVHVDPAIVR